MVPFSIEIFIVLLCGMALGSAATALVWRVPRDLSWVKKQNAEFARSACVKCEKTLGSQDLIPVFSWLFLRGRCRHCGHSIGWRYLIIELLTIAGCFGVYWVWGFTVSAFIIMAATALLVALLFIDIEHFLLPNQLIVMLAGLAFFLLLYQLVAYEASYGFGRQALFKFAGMAVFGVMAWLIGLIVSFFLQKEALGMGDVKFFAAAGLWLGVTYLPFFLVFAGLLGVLWGLFYKIILKKQLFPFGPALILTLYTGLLLQGLEIVPLVGLQ